MRKLLQKTFSRVKNKKKLIKHQYVEQYNYLKDLYRIFNSQSFFCVKVRKLMGRTLLK